MSVDFVRTPADLFAHIPDFDYPVRYQADLPGYEGMRMAYVDVGPTDAQPILCLHGQPTWGYLYRKMIPVFVAAGYRVIAPDWFGFGRSDKPTQDDVYTWDFHQQSLVGFVRALDLQDITLVVQDWGGLLGLTLPNSDAERISRLLIMNTAFNVGVTPGPGFLAWRDYVRSQPDFDIAQLISRSEPGLTDAEAAAYALPFPSPEYRAGVRRFPELVATAPTDPGVDASIQAAAWWREAWTGQSFMAVGENDPVLGPEVMNRVHKMIRNCPPPLVVPAGHFVQESAGEQVARAALDYWEAQ